MRVISSGIWSGLAEGVVWEVGSRDDGFEGDMMKKCIYSNLVWNENSTLMRCEIHQLINHSVDWNIICNVIDTSLQTIQYLQR